MTPDSFACMPALLVAAVLLSALLARQAGKARSDAASTGGSGVAPGTVPAQLRSR